MKKLKQEFKTLHQAILHVLRDGNAKSFEGIAQEISNQNLWRRKKDGDFPEAFQIRLRTVVSKKYNNLFEVTKDEKIRLQ